MSHGRRPRGAAALVAAALATACVVLAGCTGQDAGPRPPSTDRPTETITRVVTPSGHMTPIRTGPTTAATAHACPFLTEQSAAERVGMRLDAVKVLSSGGKAIGCRFFPLGHPSAQCDATCLRNEHLPPASQPVIEITSARYASAHDARAELVALARDGTNAERTPIASAVTGVCFQTDFYAEDHGRDWTCAFAKRAVVVVVRTAATASSDAAQVAKGVVGRF